MKSDNLNLRALQATMAKASALILSICSWATLWFVIRNPVDVNFVLVPIGTLGIGLVLWLQSDRHPQAVALTLVAVTFILPALGFWKYNLPYVGGFFIVPILLAAALLGTVQASIVAAFSCLFLYVATIPTGQPMLWLEPAILLTVVTAFQIPLTARSRANLQREWLHNIHYSSLVQEARNYQGEVSRLNKALNLANTLLQRNIRELAVARMEAEKARQQKEQFAVYVSHELRTPLNIILGFLEVMQRYPETYGDMQWTLTLRRDIAEIQRSARYLSDLVDDLLDLARIDAVKMPIRRELTNVEDVLREAVELIVRMSNEDSVHIQVSAAEHIPPLLIDRTRIRQVVLNLLTNASRFTEQGKIRVHAFPRDNEIVVSVSDTGSGIPADKLDTLFQDYQQVSLADAAPRSGKGLGLAIAKHFVKMHGGEIWAESQIDQGSTFYFTLPFEAIDVGRVTISSPIEEDIRRTSSTVIVLDQSEHGAAYLRRRLEEYDVMSAADWESAHALVRAHHPHALLQNVPPDARDASRELPAPTLAEGVPMIQCTLPVGSWLYEQEVFDDWLIKPVKTSRLLQLISHHCHHNARVLLVDDDHSFARLVRRVLQADGTRYDLAWSDTGEDALHKLDTQQFDLILLDVALPGIDGRALAQTVRSRDTLRHVPLIAVSGLLPGFGRTQDTPSTFAVTKDRGFSETELLGLIQNTLHHVTPQYQNQYENRGENQYENLQTASRSPANPV